MAWTPLNFGQYSGRTLPYILLTDPDYFFWAHGDDVFKGQLASEAEVLYRKATRIKIPQLGPERLVAEYVFHPSTGKFTTLNLVPASRPPHKGSSRAIRSDFIDLSVPRQFASYDKFGYGLLIADIKVHLFGSERVRMTARRCEEFFENDDNFDL